ncbi:hypothetical protein [Pelomonas cellulosilytica]|uniref:GNAT family N-acetyltransferase n=1 Tax=Pelomonas cellulosilytica TaxID=2906762 RepID=A0ABS8XK73_9BURK|nr:hypothetical protein [Pelomonas sp. P8]MCE4553241.1 hypothetical protein [Pelomonas sp. P8]
MATLRLFDAELAPFAGIPAMRPIADRLESAFAAALARDEPEADVALVDLVGAEGEVIGLYWLLNGLPPGLACLCVRDAQGCVHEGIEALGSSTIHSAQVFCRLRTAALRPTARS